MKTEHRKSVQCFQFGRRLTFFRQTRVGKQRPDVMGNPPEQVAIIRSIGLAVKLPAQRHERRELPDSADGETEGRPRGRQWVFPGISLLILPCRIVFDEHRFIPFHEPPNDRMGKLYGNRLLLHGHRTDLAKPAIGFSKRPDRNGHGREGLD